MFRRLSEALPLSEASLLAMRPALNAPVLNVGFLPVGPARAAIAVFAEEWGGIGFALGIRSNEGGQIAVFRNQESIEPEVAISEVLEPVLAEAEQMGFLFDEDMLDAQSSGPGREQAMALWGRLMGEIATPPPAREIDPEPAASEPILDLSDHPEPLLSTGELMLDEVAGLDLPEISLELEAAAQPPPPVRKERRTRGDRRAAPRPREDTQRTEPFVESKPGVPSGPERSDPHPPESALPRPPKLSKFRHVDEQVAAANADADQVEGGSELGRIPIVRIRREREGSKRTPYLARLLSSF